MAHFYRKIKYSNPSLEIYFITKQGKEKFKNKNDCYLKESVQSIQNTSTKDTKGINQKLKILIFFIQSKKNNLICDQ